MTSTEIYKNVESIVANFSREEFIFDFLRAYGISKTSISRLKMGDFNLSKNEGEILYKKKIFFKIENADELLSSIESVAKEESILKHSPRFAILTDFKNLVAKDLRLAKNLDISIQDLPSHYAFFLPLAGAEAYHASNDNEADRNAAYKMGELYDLLIQENPLDYKDEKSVHNLNLFLSRLLFCFFAEDTGIFENNVFTNTLVQHTLDNGKDVHIYLNELFRRLNSENETNYPTYLAKFPYVNGGLFRDAIESPKFNPKAYKTLVALGELQWKNINPDIFGSMIQAVVRNLDDDNTKHYTSVPNILKVIKPLFLNELEAEFEKWKDSIPQLRKLTNRISKIKFFDPACGSGNFLIIAYKEIRLLEIKILQRIIELNSTPSLEFTQIHLSQFYGIELDDFAHEMAILSLWLAEHQMNLVFEDQLFDYGKSKPILPLKEAGKIIHGNAARLNWEEVCPINENDEVYILGNPPYDGARKQSQNQKKDMDFVFKGFNKYRDLDYISIWFYKGAKYIKENKAKCAFVTTNSICQGQQVPLIWPYILANNIEIDFAYPSFKWTNNAKGNAGVTVIIVGLRNISNEQKYIYEDGFQKEVKNINSYLMNAADIIVTGRSKPLSKFPEMRKGNMPNDGGGLILIEEEKTKLLNEYPNAKKFIKILLGSSEFIRGNKRYCLWIEDDQLEEATQIPEIVSRLNTVRTHRLKSSDEAANKLALRPHQFRDRHTAKDNMLVIPSVSSERRQYIPCGYTGNDTIISNLALAVYDAEPTMFAIINSRMHMVWVRAVGGKMKTDYRYSKDICYNTFPFPEISLKQKENLNLYVFAILDERAKHPEKTMAQLYDPDKMPKGLKQAHEELDRAVEQCYRLQPFTSDTERLEYLFKMYEEMSRSGTLFEKQKKPKKTATKTKNRHA